MLPPTNRLLLTSEEVLRENVKNLVGPFSLVMSEVHLYVHPRATQYYNLTNL